MEAKNPQVIVNESAKGKFAREITVGANTILADEPTSVGGNDLGPNPYELLLAGLGACTSMTVRMYADHKKIPLERITVELNHDKVYLEDCEDCENANAKIDKIDVLIKLEGNLTEEQRQRLLDIANKCPVHRTLTSKMQINTKLV